MEITLNKVFCHLMAVLLSGLIVLIMLPAVAVPAFSAQGSNLTPVAYVTNSLVNNIVAVIDLTNNKVITTFPVGTSPAGLALSPDQSRLYVAESGDNTLTVINTSTNTVAATISVGNSPYAVAVSPDGKNVYVSNNQDNTVSIIDATTDKVTGTVKVGESPWGIKTNPLTGDVYVLNQYDGTVSVISGSNVKAVIPVGDTPAIGLAVSPDGARLYVANVNSNNVSVIDTASDTVVSSIDLGNSPDGVAFSPDGRYVYVTVLGDQVVSVIQASNNNVINSFNVHFPASVAVKPDGKAIYVSDITDGRLVALDASNGSELANISFGDYLSDIAVASINISAFMPEGTPTPSANASVTPSPSASPTPTSSPSVHPTTARPTDQTPYQYPTYNPGTVTPPADATPSSKPSAGFEGWLALLGVIGAIFIVLRKDQ